MSCDELRPDYLLYAIGSLDGPERAEVRAHLDRGCETCTIGLREARAQAYALGAAVEGPEPSPRLRARILAAAGAADEKRLSWWAVWAGAGATAVAAAVLLAYQATHFGSEMAQVRLQLARSGAQTAALREAFDLIQAPQTREVSFGGQPAPPRGRVFFHPSGILLMASNLPAPPPGKTYEMWIIPRGGKPLPAGLFASSAQGSAVYLYRPSAPPIESDTVAVTLEAAGGVGAPTTTPVIVAPL